MDTSGSPPLDQILTVDEVAAYLRVSRATICRWCVNGKLPAFKIGKGWRVRRSALEGYILYQHEPSLNHDHD
ncbi:helix-turn-helix domain-containing protein [Candidatus Chloroploca sp. M-50]|uniref:Helix-turn-helix domain-containing protein n=1 Tax=Candidatus Chloroploca mongolica TaxID=2528176 RepID=A0ABS4D4S7_9CHLR|nr:helix-turn-helix domain-containing protein [Candidatus Chloroploca mongolica]